MQPHTVLHFSSAGWMLEDKSFDQCIDEASAPQLQYILVEQDAFSTDAKPAPELMQFFQIPTHLLTTGYRRSNGFFSSAETFGPDGHLQSCYTWFRVLIKMAARDASSSYTWHEMTFCSRWTSDRCAILCTGAFPLFRGLLQNALAQQGMTLPPSEPYSLHIPLVEAVVAMQDSSVWSVRDIVRSVEKNRSLPARGSQGFLMMHEAARHAIHSFETLSVTVESVEAMQKQILYLASKSKPASGAESEASLRLCKHMEFQAMMLRNLLLRSQSNKERLQNEIALAYNMIAQRDSQVMTRLGEAARLDSGAMRTIAVVTMAFLPPTFLSAIFSMSFFNYTPAEDSTGWSVSGKIWVYWACAVPLTCLTLAIWHWRQRRVES
ncbi:hypothetical protein BU25DRAFT_409878 [Macroventuria anomochaeta]|uniref:Uncharacterized protein n=1 Tax=Macroventuria anomochaeta TaxID=301207 RepID=A0ACB6S496_9PLEO|nr:uncharacterized protein BU25DRAFT_409878 [Macroventuria anomochaeta]KAF2628863.1 hypothetical protein BU25DRAFT_409878 [Macroventuria anomochaeta]